jgi:hypothetical protein
MLRKKLAFVGARDSYGLRTTLSRPPTILTLIVAQLAS